MLFGFTAQAALWAPAGDSRLRHDLQLLADHGLLHAPLTTWPVSFADIAGNLRMPAQEQQLSPAVHRALDRVQGRIRREAQLGFSSTEISTALAHKPTRLRSFADTPRAEGELGISQGWMNERFAWQLQSTIAINPDDDKTFRLDGSYAAATLGNWMFSANAVPRWWGPGWDGSLILGTAARPVPALAVERKQSMAFDLPVLRWLGPWHVVAFLGELESDRYIPNAQLLGMRLTFKPSSKLEIGLSRTAQWAGDGRPADFDTFVKLLFGDDNRGERLAVDKEPGNQLGGIDFRWQSPLVGQLPYAVYAQFIGEDEAGGLPSRYMGLAGLEHWGSLAESSYRMHLEWANTTCNFYDTPTGYNCAYEHSIYHSGYRYRNKPLGHALDGDSRMLSLGFLLVDKEGRDWGLLLQNARVNMDGRDTGRPGGGHSFSRGTATDIQRLYLSHGRTLSVGRISLGLGFERANPTHGKASTDPQAHVRWSVGW